MAAFEILQEMLEALEQVLSAGLARRLQHLGIRQREVGRRERIDELPREELHLARRLRVEALRLGDRALHVVGGDQVRLLDVVEQEVVLPQLAPEAVVAAGRSLHGLGLAAGRLHDHGLPELQVVVPRADLRLGELRRVGPELLREFHEGAVDPEVVARRLRGVGVGLLLDELAHDLRGALGDVRERLLQGFRIDLRRLGGVGLRCVCHGGPRQCWMSANR